MKITRYLIKFIRAYARIIRKFMSKLSEELYKIGLRYRIRRAVARAAQSPTATHIKIDDLG